MTVLDAFWTRFFDRIGQVSRTKCTDFSFFVMFKSMNQKLLCGVGQEEADSKLQRTVRRRLPITSTVTVDGSSNFVDGFSSTISLFPPTPVPSDLLQPLSDKLIKPKDSLPVVLLTKALLVILLTKNIFFT